MASNRTIKVYNRTILTYDSLVRYVEQVCWSCITREQRKHAFDWVARISKQNRFSGEQAIGLLLAADQALGEIH